MLESIVLPNPPSVEPKPALKPQKDAKSASESSAFAYAHEELSIRVESRDGDVLEVRRSMTVAAGYSRSAFQCEDEGPCEVEEGKEEKGLKGTMEWVRKVTEELEKQQAKLLDTLLKGFRDGAEGNRFVMFGFVLAGAEGKVEGDDELSGIPDYWNAENTSDRIVDFATSFAAIHGDDPAFAETIINAVAEGFNQAGAILGTLPGAAGKLNRDTREMVFAKLDKWVEEWKAGAYNQSAQTVQDQALVAA